MFPRQNYGCIYLHSGQPFQCVRTRKALVIHSGCLLKKHQITVMWSNPLPSVNTSSSSRSSLRRNPVLITSGPGFSKSFSCLTVSFLCKHCILANGKSLLWTATLLLWNLSGPASYMWVCLIYSSQNWGNHFSAQNWGFGGTALRSFTLNSFQKLIGAMKPTEHRCPVFSTAQIPT